MLSRFNEFVRRNKYNNRFIKVLAENSLYMYIMHKWSIIRFLLREQPKLLQNKSDYFQKNRNRIESITDILQDEKSKIIYNGMIKYRQTIRKHDFPQKYYDKIGYFINEIKLNDAEVFVDCGAYDGDTIDDFLLLYPNYKQIVAFEPDTTNFAHLSSKHGNNPKITLVNAGVWDKNDKLHFSWAGVGGSFIDKGQGKDSNIYLDVKSIDSLELEKVTFIKMDVEGAELNALKGAKQTILRDKPKLAICIYHSDSDMLDIPEYIHSIAPDYELYVRQHAAYPFMFDTVLYCL